MPACLAARVGERPWLKQPGNARDDALYLLVALNAPALSLRHFLAALVVVCGDDGDT